MQAHLPSCSIGPQWCRFKIKKKRPQFPFCFLGSGVPPFFKKKEKKAPWY
jgi:hypothetical protein